MPSDPMAGRQNQYSGIGRRLSDTALVVLPLQRVPSAPWEGLVLFTTVARWARVTVLPALIPSISPYVKVLKGMVIHLRGEIVVAQT